MSFPTRANRLDEFIAWFTLEPRAGFTKATVSAWRVSLELRGLGLQYVLQRTTPDLNWAVVELEERRGLNGLS